MNKTSRLSIYQKIEIPMPTNYYKQCNACGMKVCGAGAYIQKISDNNRQVWICNRCISEETHPFVKLALSEGKITRAQVSSACAGESCPKPCLEGDASVCRARRVHKIFSKGAA